MLVPFYVAEKYYSFICLFRFKSDEERTPVHRIVDETFPQLLHIFNRLIQIVNPSLEVADLIKLICKIFWSSIYVCFALSMCISDIGLNSICCELGWTVFWSKLKPCLESLLHLCINIGPFSCTGVWSTWSLKVMHSVGTVSNAIWHQ